MRIVRNIARLVYIAVTGAAEGIGFWFLFLLLYFQNNPTCDVATAFRWAGIYAVIVVIIVQLLGWITEE